MSAPSIDFIEILPAGSTTITTEIRGFLLNFNEPIKRRLVLYLLSLSHGNHLENKANIYHSL